MYEGVSHKNMSMPRSAVASQRVGIEVAARMEEFILRCDKPQFPAAGKEGAAQQTVN